MQIDGAHVDPELERRSGDERSYAAGLEQFFDLTPVFQQITEPGLATLPSPFEREPRL